jgi:hypothetical protein
MRPQMSQDELRRLPGHVVAPLLRALMSIPRRPESRLYLRKVSERRMLTSSGHDYRVYFRDRNVGDIWVDGKAPETVEEKLMPWQWKIETRQGADFPTHWAGGRARTLEEAMEAFRNAWDNYQPKTGAG